MPKTKWLHNAESSHARLRFSPARYRPGWQSDLDLLVDALPGATLFDLGGLQDELETLLGVHVDLLTPTDLPAKVLAEAQPV
jgi:predicted nucleotidyltransferase